MAVKFHILNMMVDAILSNARQNFRVVKKETNDIFNGAVSFIS